MLSSNASAYSRAEHDLKTVWKCILEALQTLLKPFISSRATKGTHACENMARLAAWDASNKLYERGSSDYPWCAGPWGHSRAQAHVVLSWWKEVDGRDPSSLPAVCPRLLCTGTPLGDYTVPPCLKSQYWNNHKAKHLPLKQARVFSPQALFCTRRFFRESTFESVSQPALITFTSTRGQKVCSLSASSHTFIQTISRPKRPSPCRYEPKDQVFN